MPYESGKVFYNDKYGVSLHDVAKALGSTSLDLGTLCLRPNINMWAKFKPMPHDTPRPYTNDQRKARQWGLLPVVENANKKFDSFPLLWGYDKASGWYVLNDFISDNQYEGYVHAAPEMVTVSISQKGNAARVVFTFNGTDDNGGIKPSDLQIVNFVGDGESMADLYPGVIVYQFSSSSGYYEPKTIYTTNSKIGTNRTLTIEIPLSFGGANGTESVVVPIYSKTQYIGGLSATALTSKVLFAHNSWMLFTSDDPNAGLWLFTRRDTTSGEYFKPNRAFTTAEVNGLNEDYITFPANSSSSFLRLSPTADYGILADKDKRLAITMTLKAGWNGSYGIGDYCPLDYGGGELSEEDFERQYHDYDYPLCSWYDVDGDPVYLMLRYKAHSGEWYSSSRWTMKFLRELVFADADGKALNDPTINPEGWLAMTVNNPGNNNVTVEAVGLRGFRVCNKVTSYGSENGANGVVAQIFGDGGNVAGGGSDWSCGLWINAQYNPISFNSPLIGGSALPVETSMYIDLTVDTIDTVQNNELFN